MVEAVEVITTLFEVTAVLLVVVEVVVGLAEAETELRVGVMVIVVVVVGALLGRVVALGITLGKEPCNKAEDPGDELLVPGK